MNYNPDMKEVDDFLASWRMRSIAQMEMSRIHRRVKMNSGRKEDWEWLTDRKNITLNFK